MNDQPNNIPAFRSKRHANPHLLTALRDRPRQHSIKSDCGETESSRGESGEEKRSEARLCTRGIHEVLNGLDGGQRLVRIDSRYLRAYRRDKAAALKLLKRIMTKYGQPRKIVTNGLRAYSAAMKAISNSDRQAGAVPDCADMTTPRPERPKLKYALTEIG